jgi:nucleotide-binding universal stress UspA family protein
MKKILAPTDLSPIADNAMNYAAALAMDMNATLVLMHCAHVPVSTGETPIIMITMDELEKNSADALGERKETLLGKFPKLNIETHGCVGFAVEEIGNYVKENKVDLVVMGITGGGKLTEVLIGSTATSVMKHTEVSVLIVPGDARYHTPEKVALACDLKKVVHADGFNVMKELVNHFHSHLEVLNVVKPNEQAGLDEAVAGISLESILEDMEHTLHFNEDEDILHGIEEFINTHHIDMITMVSRKHKALDQFLHGSFTKKLAFHTHVPLLAIHE